MQPRGDKVGAFLKMFQLVQMIQYFSSYCPCSTQVNILSLTSNDILTKLKSINDVFGVNSTRSGINCIVTTLYLLFLHCFVYLQNEPGS